MRNLGQISRGAVPAYAGALALLNASGDDFLWMRMDESSGTTCLAGSGSVIESLTISGTLTNAFSNAGWITFDGSTMYLASQAEALRALCDLSTLTSGGLLVVADFYLAAKPTANEQVVSCSRDATEGGISMYLNSSASTAQLCAGIRYTGGGSVTQVTQTPANSVSVTTRQTGAVLYDIANLTTRIDLNGGASSNSAAISGALPTGATSGSNAFVIGASGSTGANNKLGSTSGAGARIANVFVRRYADNPPNATDFAAICKQMNATPSFLPRIACR
jgi:hypothetical protein